MLSRTSVFIKPGETQAYIYVIGDSIAGHTYITPKAAGYGASAASVHTYSRELDAGGGDSTRTVGLDGVNTYWVSRSTALQTPFSVTLTARTPGIVQLPVSLVMRPEESGAYIDVGGSTLGTTWVVASAPGFAADSFRIAVRPADVQVCCTQTVKRGTAVSNSAISLQSIHYSDSTRNS